MPSEYDSSNTEIEEKDDSMSTSYGNHNNSKQNIMEENSNVVPPSQPTKRLGLNGPQKKLQVKLHDISLEDSFHKELKSSDVGYQSKEQLNSIRYACTKCLYEFCTIKGYNTHLFHAHQIRKVKNHPPFVRFPLGMQSLGKTSESEKNLAKDKSEQEEIQNDKETVNSTAANISPSSDSTTYNCGDCYKTFPSIEAMRAHYSECDEFKGFNSNCSPARTPRPRNRRTTGGKRQRSTNSASRLIPKKKPKNITTGTPRRSPRNKGELIANPVEGTPEFTVNDALDILNRHKKPKGNDDKNLRRSSRIESQTEKNTTNVRRSERCSDKSVDYSEEKENSGVSDMEVVEAPIKKKERNPKQPIKTYPLRSSQRLQHVDEKVVEEESTDSAPEISDIVHEPVSKNLRSRKPEKETPVPEDNPEEQQSKEYDSTEEEEVHRCHACSKTFDKFMELKNHRKKCGQLPKKYQCHKCDKGFQQKNLFQQHYDYRHTRKPKQFVCKICETDFELKKTYLEHNKRLHNPDGFTHVCDVCGQGFYVLGEFRCHRFRHTEVKDYVCGRCGKKFHTLGRLNAHLERCGQKKIHKCKICGKFYSTLRNLGNHISEVHSTGRKKIKHTCPLCKDQEVVYSSKGGYYKHLRIKHDITRSGKTLEEEIINQQIELRQGKETDKDTGDESASTTGSDKN